MLPRFILLLLAVTYYCVYKLHHRYCLQPGEPLRNATLYVIGSFRIGGAGKTPFTAWFAQFLLENHAGSLDATGKFPAHKGAPRIAILCHSKAADEAEMLRQKFAGTPQVQVFTTGNRYRTAHEIDSEFDIIICDDGFEDTRFVNARVIRLDSEEPPTKIGSLVPAGKNRSLAQDHDEPALVLGPSDISFRIAQVANANGEPCPANPTAVCGIGNPEKFREDLAAFGITPAKFIAKPDHDRHFEQTFCKYLEQGGPIVITEKDLARIPEKYRTDPQIFVAFQEITVSETAVGAIRAACGLLP